MTCALRLILIAIVVLTSQQLALARGQATVAGEIVLCVGGGLVSLSVDADGNPTGPPHICPDGVQAMAFAIPEPALPLHARTVHKALYMLLPAAPDTGLQPPVPQARAPPVAV